MKRIAFWKERRLVRDWWIQCAWDWSCMIVGVNFGVPKVIPGAWVHLGPLIVGCLRRKPQ